MRQPNRVTSISRTGSSLTEQWFISEGLTELYGRSILHRREEGVREEAAKKVVKKPPRFVVFLPPNGIREL
ncbi:hypothetical protein SESBI_06652 [Sesbania bispinosa]|nr:hypothetical protein SESBI_06652 [Sesbania bispinosa]